MPPNIVGFHLCEICRISKFREKGDQNLPGAWEEGEKGVSA